MKKLLIIDDDEELLDSLKTSLNSYGFDVITANNGQEGIEIIKKEYENLGIVITDIAMPVMTGVEVCRIIKQDKVFRNLPVLMLTTMADLGNKYLGFTAGADDYITKPFEQLELMLRVKALMKRDQLYKDPEELKDTTKAQIKMNKNNYSITVRNQEIYLNPLEFDMLYYLYNNANRLISIDEFFQKVFKYPPDTGNSDTIRTHIKNIRAKIEEDPANPKIITNVPKRGYMFNL